MSKQELFINKYREQVDALSNTLEQQLRSLQDANTLGMRKVWAQTLSNTASELVKTIDIINNLEELRKL